MRSNLFIDSILSCENHNNYSKKACKLIETKFNIYAALP